MGRYLKEFTVGKIFESRGRTITEADVVQFAQFSGDWNPVHVDQTVAEPMFGARIAHGPMFPGIAIGLMAPFDLAEGTAIALKSMTWEFTAPVRIGDTVRAVCEITSVSPHPTKRDRGRVGFKYTLINQDGVTVNHGTTVAVMQTGET